MTDRATHLWCPWPSWTRPRPGRREQPELRGEREAGVQVDLRGTHVSRGALVVAAAGNDVNAEFEFPAAQNEVLGSTALAAPAMTCRASPTAASGLMLPQPGTRSSVPYPETEAETLVERIRHSARKLLSKQPFGVADLFSGIEGRV